jgi:hypothetical protein
VTRARSKADVVKEHALELAEKEQELRERLNERLSNRRKMYIHIHTPEIPCGIEFNGCCQSLCMGSPFSLSGSARLQVNSYGIYVTMSAGLQWTGGWGLPSGNHEWSASLSVTNSYSSSVCDLIPGFSSWEIGAIGGGQECACLEGFGLKHCLCIDLPRVGPFRIYDVFNCGALTL